MSDEQQPGDRAAGGPGAVDALAGFLSGISGLAAADAVGPLAGVAATAAIAPAAWGAASKVARELGFRRQASAAMFLDEVARQMGVDPSGLPRLALGDPRIEQAFADAIVAAADSINEQKVRALARALANGLIDDAARIDEIHLVVRALAGLEAPHVKVIAATAPHGRGNSYSLEDVATLVPGLSEPAAGAIIAGLERAHIFGSDREAMRQATAETIRLSRRAAEEDARQEQRRTKIEGPEVPWLKRAERRTPEALQVRDEPAWVVTDFGLLCWHFLDAASRADDGLPEDGGGSASFIE